MKPIQALFDLQEVLVCEKHRTEMNSREQSGQDTRILNCLLGEEARVVLTTNLLYSHFLKIIKGKDLEQIHQY